MGTKYTSLSACGPSVIITFEGSVWVHHNILFTCLPTYCLELLEFISAWRVRVEGAWRCLSQTSSQSAAGVCKWSRAVLQNSTVWLWIKRINVYMQKHQESYDNECMTQGTFNGLICPEGWSPKFCRIFVVRLQSSTLYKGFLHFFEVVQILLRSFL